MQRSQHSEEIRPAAQTHFIDSLLRELSYVCWKASSLANTIYLRQLAYQIPAVSDHLHNLLSCVSYQDMHDEGEKKYAMHAGWRPRVQWEHKPHLMLIPEHFMRSEQPFSLLLKALSISDEVRDHRVGSDWNGSGHLSQQVANGHR